MLLLMLEPQLLRHVGVYRQLCMRMHKQLGLGALLASPLRLLSAVLLLFDLLPKYAWPLTHFIIYKTRCFLTA